MKSSILLGYLPLALYSGMTYAATGDVIFNATVDATCTLQVISQGMMTVNPDLQSMTSKNVGGIAGNVSVATTGGVTIGVSPTVVASVPSGDSATTWAPEYSVAGAHTITPRSTNAPLSTPGTSDVTVHLTGTKGGTDRFTKGAYQATVTVTCE